MTTETYNLAAVALQTAGLFVAIAAAMAVYVQLRQAARSLSTSSLMAVLALEDAIARARTQYTDALAEAARFRRQLDSLSENERKPGLVFLSILERRFEERGEQYLNALDRLCACIIRGDVDEERYRQDYRGGIQDAMDGHAPALGANTRHPNIVKVHAAWRDDRSAREPSAAPGRFLFSWRKG